MVLATLLKKGFILGSLALFISISQASAQYKNERYASLERSKDAVGHYARARAMLVRALQEFEEGRKLAQPDLLLDSEEWRLSIISRAEELNRVLDPQPQVVRSGTRFSASPLQVERKKQQLPPLEIGPADNNTQGEEERARQKEIEAVKARMAEVSKDYAPKPQDDEPGYLAIEPIAELPKVDVAPIQKSEPAKQIQEEADSGLSLGDIIPGDLTIPEAESEKTKEPAKKAPALFGANPSAVDTVENVGEVKKTTETGVNAETDYDDDAAVSQAIERSIKERLNKINGGAN